jgi:predicted transposase/invertase (TIGR01784 family)
MKPRYINPFTDFGFKKLFGEESQKLLLIDFLNALLPPRHQIEDLSYSKNEASGSTVLDRKAIFDIACVGKNGERFIVELQKAKQNFFKDRSVFYATFPIQEQAERGGEWNFSLAAVYCVGILDFVFHDARPDANEIQAYSNHYLHIVQLKDQFNRVFYDKLTFVYVEMPNFTKTEAELHTKTDKWLYFIKHLEEFSDVPHLLRDEIFEAAFHTAEIAQFSPAQMQAYQDSLRYYRDLKNVIDTSFEEGVGKGFEEGFEEGMEEGKIDAQRAIARKLQHIGLSDTEIQQATGLSAKDLNNE